MSGLIGIRTPIKPGSAAQPAPTQTHIAQAACGPSSGPAGTPQPVPAVFPQRVQSLQPAASLGVLSVHFERGRCRVLCPFCYLGQREGAVEAEPEGLSAGLSSSPAIDEPVLALLEDALRRLPYRELAITLSEPIEPLAQSGALSRLLRVASERRLPSAVTTTLAVAVSGDAALLCDASRLNLSIDSYKGPAAGRLQAPVGQVSAHDVEQALRQIRHKWPTAERVLIATLSTQRFAQQLCDGLLAELLALPTVDRIALNAVKPPPPWCDRAFWLRMLHSLRPLLAEHLDRRLFLDCYVAARILGLGDCPARPDLSPAPVGDASARSAAAPLQLAFRSCVYQPRADFTFDASDDLSRRLQGFVPPAVCPFPIR